MGQAERGGEREEEEKDGEGSDVPRRGNEASAKATDEEENSRRVQEAFRRGLLAGKVHWAEVCDHLDDGFLVLVRIADQACSGSDQKGAHIPKEEGRWLAFDGRPLPHHRRRPFQPSRSRRL